MTEYTLSSEEAIAQNTLTGIITDAFLALDKGTPNDEGTNYKSLYYGLFNGITAIIGHTATFEQATDALRQLQRMAEDAYIRQGDS
jgi:hypothetical protein